MPRRILVIEDDKDIAHLVELHLKDTGYEVTLAHDGNAGLDRALSKPYDLIILDLMLPGMDGLEICRRVRAAVVYTPVVVLTSKSSELDRVLGLEIGADDYLTKPFSIRELIARVKALFRRIEALKSEASQKSRRLIQTGDLDYRCGKAERHAPGKSRVPDSQRVRPPDPLCQSTRKGLYTDGIAELGLGVRL